MSPSQAQPSFRELHQPGNPFILANAWDMGSAKMMAKLGAKAIATTSAGHAFTLGRPDMGHVSRDEAIEHAADLVKASSLPVSGDLENGYGHSDKDVVDTIEAAIEAGLAGCCIEDTSLPDVTPYEFDHSVERIAAGIKAARSAQSDFVLTARADGIMNGQYGLDEAIRRIQAYEKVGADVAYVPFLQSLEDAERICNSVEIPVNVLCSGNLANLPLSEFANAGVARISLGSMLSRVTHQVIADASAAMFGKGDFSILTSGAKRDAIDRLLTD